MNYCGEVTSSKGINSSTHDFSKSARNCNNRKQSISDDASNKRRRSHANDGIPTYLRHTATSYRRMSIVQEMNPRLGRKASNISDLHFAPSDSFGDLSDIHEDDFFSDNTNSDLNEIESEILRVEHFISDRSKHLKLDQLQQDLTFLTKTVGFEEPVEEQQTDFKENKRKVIVDSYLQRRRSSTKSPYTSYFTL